MATRAKKETTYQTRESNNFSSAIDITCNSFHYISVGSDGINRSDGNSLLKSLGE